MFNKNHKILITQVISIIILVAGITGVISAHASPAIGWNVPDMQIQQAVIEEKTFPLNNNIPHMIEDIWQGSESSYPGGFTVFNSELYFSARDDVSGWELRKYDGISVNLVADINSSGDGSPGEFIEYDNTLYFSADDGVHGRELWKYDGVTASLVADIRNGNEGSHPTFFTIFDGLLYFTANDGVAGIQIWKYDGSTLTMLPDDIHPSGLLMALGSFCLQWKFIFFRCRSLV